MQSITGEQAERIEYFTFDFEFGYCATCDEYAELTDGECEDCREPDNFDFYGDEEWPLYQS